MSYVAATEKLSKRVIFTYARELSIQRTADKHGIGYGTLHRMMVENNVPRMPIGHPSHSTSEATRAALRRYLGR